MIQFYFKRTYNFKNCFVTRILYRLVVAGSLLQLAGKNSEATTTLARRIFPFLKPDRLHKWIKRMWLIKIIVVGNLRLFYKGEILVVFVCLFSSGNVYIPKRMVWKEKSFY